MQIICLFVIVQFHLMINSLTLGFQILEVEINDSQVYLLLIGALQFVTHTCILFIILMRPKFQTNKNYIFTLISIAIALSVVMISLNYSAQLLILVILQLESLCFMASFLVIPKEKIALGIIVQIYLLGLIMNLTPFYLWSTDIFSFGRAIAILGSTVFGLITLGLCMLCQLKPNNSLTEELHIIVGFYLFCEIFTCCMFGAEASYYYQESDSHFNRPIIFTILKISNSLLDILIYPFSKYKKEDRVTISKVIPDRSDIGKSEVFVMTTKETESECPSATKIVSENKTKTESNNSSKWIKKLLEIQ